VFPATKGQQPPTTGRPLWFGQEIATGVLPVSKVEAARLPKTLRE